ncbi:hypothetical protein PAPYR_7448 [Paratrimastix pyriformis]|uniref:CYTH domain-containing protein n=1 Tax=Paratrimastix pyriformis TaxID=342808 RepID=A0ABQ8UD12_9EUKA|nr:hypothetical protein PAPYR_7448 [Paratrimastix pyriformis]
MVEHGAGMEWRVFFARNSFPELDARSLFAAELDGRQDFPIEHRIDKYYCATEDVGIKLRGERKLEMKVCLGRFPSRVEQWTKMGLSRGPGAPLSSALEPFKQMRPVQHALSSAHLAEGFEPPMVTTDKHRFNVGIAGCSVEQCDLTVTVGPTQQALAPYRSFAIEGPDRAAVERLVGTLCTRLPPALTHPTATEGQPALGQGIMGFPAFVVALEQQGRQQH